MMAAQACAPLARESAGRIRQENEALILRAAEHVFARAGFAEIGRAHV